MFALARKTDSLELVTALLASVQAVATIVLYVQWARPL